MDENNSKIVVNVHQIRDLDYDGDLTLKLELGDKVLGESDKITNAPSSFVVVEFSVTHVVDQNDYSSLDEVVSKPLICSIIGLSLKDNKDDKEKSTVIAQCYLELQQFVLGETFFRSCFQLQPFPGSSFEQSPNSLKAEIELSICCNGPLVNEEDLKNGNLLTFTVESLMSPPESWETLGQNFNYIAACCIPQTCMDDVLGVFSSGKYLKPLENKEVHDDRKKWSLPGSAVGDAAYLSHRKIGTEKYSDESGDLRTCEDFAFRKNSYKCKPRVQWNQERKIYLGKEAVEKLKCKILQSRYLPLEIYRISTGDKGSEKTSDEMPISFHGVAYVDVTPLIHPGGSRIRGAYRVVGFDEEELKAKAKQQKSIAEDAKKLIIDQVNVTSSPVSSKKEDAKEKKAPNKNASNKNKEIKKGHTPKVEEVHEDESEDKKKVEGEEYSKAASYVMLEICLDHPFYPKKTSDESSLKVSNIIPPRPIYPKKTNTSEKALTDYRSKIISVAKLLLDEFEKFFNTENENEDSTETNDQNFEERRQKLLYHLNSSGKYLAFKEQVRHAVVKIVRDRFCRTTVFECSEEFQCFLSELYTLLVDEMHSSLLKFIAAEEKPDPIHVTLTDEQLKHFAQEADFVHKHCLAEKYYFERISRDRRNPDYWFDAGCHYMLIEDFNRAGECFKECVAVDCKHLNGLIMSGVCHTYRDCTGVAECLFEAATVNDPSNIAAWVMLGLFYDHIGNVIMFEKAISEACHLAFKRPEYVIPCPEEKIEQEVEVVAKSSPETSQLRSSSRSKSKKAPKKEMVQVVTESVEPLPDPETPVMLKDSVYVDALAFLTSANEIIFREKALARHAVDCYGGFNFSYYLEMSQLYIIKKLYCEAEEFINIAINMCMQVPKAWTTLGHLRYLMNDYENAACCFERRISYGSEDTDLHYVYLRLGAALIYMSKFQESKQIYLTACKKNPTCLTWLGAGIACYRLSQIKEAEEALIEANFLNNEDPEVWAYLCMVSMQKCRHFEAKQAYKYALRSGLCNALLCSEIMQLQQATGICLE